MITKDKVMSILTPDFKKGIFVWINPSKYHSEKIGVEAGCVRRGRNGKDYWYIKIDGVAYKRGHLMFLVINGRLPRPCLDHIDGNSLNDNPLNIREATVMQNAWNHKHRTKKSQLPMGVRIICSSGRYQARIGYKKTMIHIGTFDTVKEAHEAYQNKRIELYGEFA